MTDALDDIVINARAGNGPCEGCPATQHLRKDGRPLSDGVNPGLGTYDATVMFVTIEPSPAHGKAINWDAYSWAEYNERYYEQLLEGWDSGEAVREIIDPIKGLTTDAVWVADSVKCPPRKGEDNQNRAEEFAHCRNYLAMEIDRVAPEIIVGIGNRSVSRTLAVLGGQSGRIGTATEAGRRFPTEPPLLVSPSWSHGWLFDRPIHPKWGGEWLELQPELQGIETDSYLGIVQTSLDAYLTG